MLTYQGVLRFATERRHPGGSLEGGGGSCPNQGWIFRCKETKLFAFVIVTDLRALSDSIGIVWSRGCANIKLTLQATSRLECCSELKPNAPMRVRLKRHSGNFSSRRIIATVRMLARSVHRLCPNVHLISLTHSRHRCRPVDSLLLQRGVEKLHAAVTITTDGEGGACVQSVETCMCSHGDGKS